MNDNPKRRAGASNWNDADTCRKFVAAKLQAVDWQKDPPIAENGYGIKFIGKFGGAGQLWNAVNKFQSLLYAA